MKQVFSITLSAVFAAILLIGCSDGSTLVETDQGSAAAASDELAALGKAGASGPSANGHTNLTIGDGIQTFSFHARQNKDGTVRGSFENKSRGQDQRYHGSIDCLRIEENEAWMSGNVTQVVLGDDPDFPISVGNNVWFRVLDGGEGAQSTDQWTDIFIGGAGLQDCNTSYAVGYVDNEAGNIQVIP